MTAHDGRHEQNQNHSGQAQPETFRNGTRHDHDFGQPTGHSEFDSGPWPTLDYGQTRSLGAITCDSEPSGMTCTDAGSGHFFRLSRDSYQVG
jgi:hypothetical protein